MEPNSCRLNVHEFCSPLQNVVAHYYVIQLKDSYFLWIGSAPSKFSNLSLALLTKYNSVPTTTNIMGDISDVNSSSLAQKLSRKCKKAVFVSYNLPADPELLPLVENRLFEEISAHPDRF